MIFSNESDNNKRPSLMDAMINAINNKAPNDIPLELMESSVFFVVASLANSFYGYRIKKTDGSESMVNYFGLSFFESGGGKNLSYEATAELFKEVIDFYPNAISTAFKKNKNAPNGDSLIRDEDFYMIPDSFFTPIDGTKEGFQKLMQGMSVVNGSSLNLVEDEFGDILMNADMLSRIKSAWDNGEAKGKTTASSKYFSLKGVCVNILSFGSPHSIQKSRVKSDKLDDILIEGFLRRSFIFYSRYTKIVRNKQKGKMLEIDAIAIKNECNEWRDTMVKPTVEKRQYITISKQAQDMIDDYIDNWIELTNRNTKDLFNRAMVTSAEKLIRLAGIIAIMDFSTSIEQRHMSYAIDFSDRTVDMAKKIFEKEPKYVKIFDVCRDMLVARHDIMEDADIQVIKSFDENIELSEEYGEKMGYALIRHKIGKTMFYKFESLHKVDEDKISMSISKDLAQGYETKVGRWIELHKLLSADINYSAGSFKDNHRNKENYLGSQDVVIFDIDGGMSLNIAKAFFSQWKCIIATTKSHQKDKNGIICDRYRVILLPNVKLELDSERYSEFMKNIINKLSIPADMSCTDSSRFYYGYSGSEIWYSESQNRFDISCCIPETKKDKEQKERYESNKNIKSTSGVDRYFLQEMSNGNRNNMLLKYCLMMKDAGEDWREKTLGLNSMLTEPLNEMEIEHTIFKTAGKK
jgi:Protein of unknown function (DUF3987)